MKRLFLAMSLASLAGLSLAQTPTPAPVKSPGTAATAGAVQAKVVGEYKDGIGIRRKYYVVPADLSDAQLIALATQLHRTEKDAWLWLLNSDTQAAQMMAALPKTVQGDFSNYPGKWVEQHTAGHTGLQALPKGKGRQWVLMKGPYSEQLAVLPCLDKLCTQ